MREAYSFVAANYEPGDEIILMGFSRGAFTARGVAVSGLIPRSHNSQIFTKLLGIDM